MGSETVWVQLRCLFKVIDRGINIARQRVSDSQKHMSIWESGRMFDAASKRRDRPGSVSTLQMRHSFLKALPGFNGYSRGRCALQRHRKFHELSFF